MATVTQLRPVVRHEIDLPMEVLGVLYCHEPLTAHEIAHDIEMATSHRMDSAAFVAALQRLRVLGYEIHEHAEPDGVRYELVTGGTAA